VHVQLAWLYVLPAHLKGDGVEYRDRQPESRGFTGGGPTAEFAKALGEW
jgi:hypothetical protein